VAATNKTRFITLQELCEQLGISKTRYYQLREKGVLPAPQRAGNRPRFRHGTWRNGVFKWF